jgi:pimeloyl-ACP methyl ester carboxylesterase
MGLETGFRKAGRVQLQESVPEAFWQALRSGLSPTAAATVAGCSDVQLVTVDWVGHWIVEERPQSILDRLRAFLGENAMSPHPC